MSPTSYPTEVGLTKMNFFSLFNPSASTKSVQSQEALDLDIEHTSHESNSRRIQTKDCDSKPPCAVIATIYSGSSYDDLFRSVEQISPDSNYSIALFQFDYNDIPSLISSLHGEEERITPVIQQFITAAAQVSPNSVVFNFECCSQCNEHGFPSGLSQAVMRLLNYLLTHSHMAMFADFSLKALIHDWDEEYLGPNPLVQVGTCSGSMKLCFDPETLSACQTSAQLQNIGRICSSGCASLHTLGGTIVFSVLPSLLPGGVEAMNNHKYRIEVLTVSSNHEGFDPSLPLSPSSQPGASSPTFSSSPPSPSIFTFMHSPPPTIPPLHLGEGKEGQAGHVLLKYSTGGSLLLSAGHWIELSHVDVNEEGLARAVQSQLGEESSREMNQQMTSCSSEREREEVRQVYSRRVVQSSAPCSYSSSFN